MGIEVPAPKIPENQSEACQYALRPVVHEIRKKEGNIKFQKMAKLKHRIDRNGTSIRLDAKETIAPLEYLGKILREGISSTVPYKFGVRLLPRLDCCASSLLNRPKTIELEQGEPLPDVGLDQLSDNIVNMFPFEKNTVVIVGAAATCNQDAEEFLDVASNGTEGHVTRLLSNVLIAQIEDWAISEELLRRLPRNIGNTISKAKCSVAGFYEDFALNFFTV